MITEDPFNSSHSMILLDRRCRTSRDSCQLTSSACHDSSDESATPSIFVSSVNLLRVHSTQTSPPISERKIGRENSELDSWGEVKRS